MKKIYLKSYPMNVAKGLDHLYNEIIKQGGYAISSYKKEMEKIELMNYETGKKEKDSYFGDWLFLNFIIDNDAYYIQFDENPFFEDYFSKQPTDGKTISRDVYLEKIDKLFFDYRMTDEEIEEAAKKLLQYLKDQKYSKKHIEYKKQRIYNLYDGGYHYENVRVKERIEKVHKITGKEEAQG